VAFRQPDFLQVPRQLLPLSLAVSSQITCDGVRSLFLLRDSGAFRWLKPEVRLDSEIQCLFVNGVPHRFEHHDTCVVANMLQL
jgi:hypothetical protein